MAQIWLISDTHFGHKAMYELFKLADGSPARPFSSADLADQAMADNWVKLVKPSDKLYHLGDVTMDRKYLGILAKLPGHKRLVRGNHDIFRSRFYEPYFEEIYGVRVFDGMILSHIPIHPDCLNKRWLGNIHGHTHSNFMPDSRYLNVCVEQTRYAPIAIEEAKQRLIAQLKSPAQCQSPIPSPSCQS